MRPFSKYFGADIIGEAFRSSTEVASAHSRVIFESRSRRTREAGNFGTNRDARKCYGNLKSEIILTVERALRDTEVITIGDGTVLVKNQR